LKPVIAPRQRLHHQTAGLDDFVGALTTLKAFWFSVVTLPSATRG